MKFMSRAFRKMGSTFYSPCEDRDCCPMDLGWLDALEIPETAETLWFELRDTSTDGSIPVRADLGCNCVDLCTGNEYSALYFDEFAGKADEKLRDLLEGDLVGYVDMHLQVLYRE